MTKTELSIRQLFLVDKLSDEQIAARLGIQVDKIQKVTSRFKTRKKSNLEQGVGCLLRQIYPGYVISDQKRIGNLYLDYYVEDIRLAIEADGIQHYKVVPFYHGNTRLGQQINFEHQAENDAKKEKLAKEQYIYLIRIKYDEKLTIDNLRRILNEHSSKIIDNLNKYSSENRTFK